MHELLITASLAVVHTLAIMGYLSILLWIAYQFQGSSRWMGAASRILLFVLGAGSLFFAPAYVYGKYKSLITDQTLVTFGVVELMGMVGVLFLVKSFDTMLSEKLRTPA